MCDLRPLQGGRSKILELLGGHQLSFNKTVFIVLHGVGNPDEGANKLAVEAVLRDELPPLMASESWTVDEFYWNSKVPFPLKDGRLDGRQISNIAAGWAKASRLRKKQSGRPIFPGLYQLADAGLGMLEAASGLYWFMLPILLLVDVLDESAFNFTRTITEAALIIAGSCLTTIAFAGLASGQNPRELLRSLLFIIGLPPLLLLAWAICWFRQPFVLRDDVDAGEFPYFMVSSILFLVWVLLHVVTVISLMWGDDRPGELANLSECHQFPNLSLEFGNPSVCTLWAKMGSERIQNRR